jgi:thioredoxin reductase
MSCVQYQTDIAVLGAGPAGLAAGLVAGQAGAKVVIVDAFPEAGGQYYMQPANDEPGDERARLGREAIAATRRANVTLLTGTEIFAAYPAFSLYGSGAQGPVRISAKAVIVATGAHDRTVAFPGWTLPGVMTAGGGQRLAKVNSVLPGRRVAIAGSGPFLLAVAQSLLRKGASIAAVIEARKTSLALALHLAAYPERWAEAWALFRSVRAGVDRMIHGKVVCEAIGSDRVTGIRLTEPGNGSSELIEGIDALLVSYGFQPAIDLTSLLGCTHSFDDDLGGWFVDHTADSGLTSVSGVYAAGETLGVAGAAPAALTGELAGLSAALSVGQAVDGDRIESIRRRLARARAFGHGLGRLYAPLPELASLAREETVLCRCEDVTCGELREACRDGARSAYSAKMWTRAGMGRCQGRICRMSIASFIASETGRSLSEVGYNRPRIPVRPIPLGDALAALNDASVQ